MQELFSGIHGVPSILYTGLTNIGMIFHPTPILLNYTRIESGQTFLYYKEAITPMVAQYISQVDAERVAVAAGLGLEVETALEWLVRSYGIEPGADLYETIQKNPAYADVYAPQSTDCRYVWEDVPTGLVPISSVGRLLGIPTPFIDTVIQLPANLFFGVSIATCIIVLKKCKRESKTLFIDASNRFVHEGNKNKLSPDDIKAILDEFIERKEIKHFSALVENRAILDNDCNLSVSSYVEAEDTKPETDIVELNERIQRIVARENELRAEIDKIIAELEG